MKLVKNNFHLNKASALRITTFIVILTIFLSSSFFTTNSNNKAEDLDRNFNDISQIPVSADIDSVLFEGIELPLNITDYGNLYDSNQDVSLSNQEGLNLTYYLDEIHDWKASQINISVNDIYDTRNWVNNSGFNSPTIFRVYQEFETSHPYNQPHNPSSVIHTIVGNHNPTYMRVHFKQLGFERFYDYLYVLDGSDQYHLITDVDNSTSRYNVYSPWIPGDTIQLTYRADNADPYYGYKVDYYEYVNDSSNYDINSDTWEFNYVENGASGTNIYGAGECGNATAMYVGLYGNYIDYYDFDYTQGAFSELYQNITIPRGSIKDAYLSFDYNVPFGLESNDNYIYFKINNKKVYSKGMGDIIEAGKNKWFSTGKIYLDLWTNTTSIFEGLLNEQNFNISVGIMSGSSVELSYFEEAFQNIVWFDNISLVVTASSNSTQSDINLKLNGMSLNDKEWGNSDKELIDNWESNPITLNFTTESPDLTFILDTMINGYHETHSKLGQTTNEGISYEILENGTIIWEFSHNFYMPAQYSDFEFTIEKPENWNFISVLDPTLQSRSYDYGNKGDLILHINKENAIFPGWWTFRATSPNYLNINNTKLLKQGEWVDTPFDTGESTIIKTQVNYSNEVPSNLDLTSVNLTIYDPESNQWFTELKTPLSNGTVFFSEITFSALNTTGGQFDYTLFWSNGTALGGIKSNFIVNHKSQLKMLKPDDAKVDLRTDGFVGDIIPVRVILTDPENNFSISNAIISYNWTGGSTLNFTEAAIGVYETILDTADLSSRGLYEILINSSKIGFIESNLTLEINLGEETGLQRLESEYNIELHANSTIKFKFTDFSGDGIDGATVNISISNSSHYSIDSLGDGIYEIEFSTVYIINIGIYEINFTFSATGYEPQYYAYQFQIIEQSVNLSVYLNSVGIQENSLHEVNFFDTINISAKAMSIIDEIYISGGNLTWISDSLNTNLTEFLGNWYNTSIECLPEYFSSGINFIYLKFEHPNYRTQTFGFEILVDRIEFNVDIVGHEDSNPTIKAEIGGSLLVDIELLDIETSQPIVNATISYEWKYGVGELEEISPGLYRLSVILPENLQGNFIFNLIISKEGTVYKTTQCSFLLVIGEPEFPAFLIWIIILISALIIGALGIMSLRSYVILPRRRKREAELLSRTQRFKDIENVQAIVVIHKDSGIPLYTKSYSILEKHKKEIFSGFIQAIITVGEEMVGKRDQGGELVKIDKEDKTRSILELDFKYFYCLICDRQELRIIFILTERASDRLKNLISDLSLGAMLELSEQIGNWDGAIHEFETQFPPIINNYIELYFKEPFMVNNAKSIAKVRKDGELNSMETRILNVVYSIAKNKNEFYLDTIFELIHEKNKDIVIDGIETLINKQIIIPSTK